MEMLECCESALPSVKGKEENT